MGLFVIFTVKTQYKLINLYHIFTVNKPNNP